jgi:hypothetical protein
MYRLDRTAFKKQSSEEADDTLEYWLRQTPEERWRAAWYLTCAAYGIDPENPPKMDKTVFSARKHGQNT